MGLFQKINKLISAKVFIWKVIQAFCWLCPVWWILSVEVGSFFWWSLLGALRVHSENFWAKLVCCSNSPLMIQIFDRSFLENLLLKFRHIYSHCLANFCHCYRRIDHDFLGFCEYCSDSFFGFFTKICWLLI